MKSKSNILQKIAFCVMASCSVPLFGAVKIASLGSTKSKREIPMIFGLMSSNSEDECCKFIKKNIKNKSVLESPISDTCLNTPLHHAIWEQKDKIIKCLLDAGVNVNIIGDNNAPLHFAVESGNQNMVRLLLEYGADVNIKSKIHGKTSLILATQNGDIGMLKILLDANADPLVKSSEGSALDLALHPDCQKELQKAISIRSGKTLPKEKKKESSSLAEETFKTEQLSLQKKKEEEARIAREKEQKIAEQMQQMKMQEEKAQKERAEQERAERLLEDERREQAVKEAQEKAIKEAEELKKKDEEKRRKEDAEHLRKRLLEKEELEKSEVFERLKEIKKKSILAQRRLFEQEQSFKEAQERTLMHQAEIERNEELEQIRIKKEEAERLRKAEIARKEKEALEEEKRKQMKAAKEALIAFQHAFDTHLENHKYWRAQELLEQKGMTHPMYAIAMQEIHKHIASRKELLSCEKAKNEYARYEQDEHWTHIMALISILEQRGVEQSMELKALIADLESKYQKYMEDETTTKTHLSIVEKAPSVVSAYLTGPARGVPPVEQRAPQAMPVPKGPARVAPHMHPYPHMQALPLDPRITVPRPMPMMMPHHSAVPPFGPGIGSPMPPLQMSGSGLETFLHSALGISRTPSLEKETKK
jgi:hypothetical protein